MIKIKRVYFLYFSLLIILILVAYFNSLDNAFLSDDLAEIVNNPNIGDLGYSISSHPFGFIRLVFYFLAYHIAGLNQVAFRLINVFLHIGSVLLIFTLISYIHSKKVAIFASALFAVHPILIEGVSWISGGMYPQYTFFFLISLVFYILSDKQRKMYFLSLLFYLFSFMSHPVMPASLALIYPLYELVFGNLKKNWAKSLPYFGIVLVYVFINLASLPERETTLQSFHYQERGIDNPFFLVPVAITSYIYLIFWPKDLTLYHSELAFSGIQFAFILLLFLTFIALLALSFKKNKAIFFWLSLFFISLTPTLTPFRLNWIVAERYVYLGSLGIFVSLALILDKTFKKENLKPLFFVILAVLVTMLSVRTILRNIDWHSEDNLWIATGKTSPSSPNTHNNLGDVYGRWGNKQKALEEFLYAIELKPNYADAYHNAGNVYRELGQIDKALEFYQKAASINPNLWQSYQNIAAIYFEAKEFDKAQEFIQKAIQINPKNLNLYNNLGIIYLFKDEKDKAKEVFNAVLSTDPQNQLAKQGLLEASKP